MGRKTKVNIAALWGAIVLLCVGFSIPAAASYIPFNTNVNMNIGIGTETPQGAFVVTNGNVGVGTWAPSAPLTVGANAFTVNSTGAIATSGGYTQSGNGINAFTGNIGIGSAAPGQALDVNGTVRMVNFTMSGQTPVTGYVLTASDSAGDSTWASASAVGGWTVSGNNVYESAGGNVGIGTTEVGQGSLVVTNGNVGIGTWAPSAPLTVGANAFTVNSTGAITAMTGITTSGGYTQTGNSINAFNGNVGIGSAAPGQVLDVNGTIRMTFLTMSGQTPVTGYVLTASDSAGDTTWASASAVGGWTVSGNNVYESAGGNVGIGSINPGQALDVNGTVRMTGLTLTNNGAGNGNVLVSNAIGVGTWMPAGTLVTSSQWTSTNTNDVYLSNNGNVGIGTFLTSTAALTVMNGNVGIGTWIPSAPLTVGANAFTVNSTGAITAMTGITTSGGYTQTGNSINAFNGNVGIGSAAPGQALDVNGTVRMMNFTMSGQTPISGYVLTASDSAGDTTWTSASAVSGWTVSGNNVYETLSGNVGIGTTAISQGALVVTNGNVGIGTWVPSAPLTVGANAFTVNSTGAITATTGITTSGGYTQTGNSINAFNGNVGIGSAAPGQALDVNGTVRMVNFTMSGQTPISGYVLTASDSAGDTTWTSAGSVSGWTTVGNNVYQTLSGNVGIGTTAISQGALVVTNGNVGIGTWVPTAPLTVGANAFTVNSTGAIATTGGYTQSGNGINTFGGNVGIGSLTPGQALDVSGTVRMTGLTLTNNGANNGYVLVTNTIGIGTWMSPTTLVTSSQWITANTNDVYLPLSGNVGLGTFLTSTAALTVMNGNVGIGTWKPAGALDIKTGTNVLIENGNLGIGSLTPGQALDVNGTVRMTLLTMSGQTPISGYVLTASDSAGDTTWTSGPAVAGWTISGNNVYESLSGNVGIGTTTVTQGALVVTNGNVGIGTWAPNALLSVNGPAVIGVASGYVSGGYNPSNGLLVQGNVGVGTFDTTNYTFNVGGTAQIGGGYLSLGLPGVNLNGIALAQSASTLRLTNTNNIAGSLGVTVSGVGSNVGINTTQLSGGSVLVVNGGVSIGTSSSSTAYFTTAAPAGGMIVAGNVGVGSTAPGQALDVAGTIRTAAFVMSGQTPISGYVLTASDSAGDTTWSSAPSVAGWTISGNNVYESLGGNVGIGTTAISQGALVVTNGNVGIGTWVPSAPLTVGANAFTVNSTGAITAMTGITTSGGYTQTGNSINAFNGNVGIGSAAPGQALDVAGTVRMVNFTMSGQTPISGYVLTASDSAGDTTWTSAGSVSGWTIVGNNVYETFSGNVGIGTTALQAALAVTNGNVGIGTWTAANPLSIVGGVSIGTTGMVNTPAPANGLLVSGNVGIGSAAPGQALDVNGTVRMTLLTMSGQTPISGYVLTASDSAGDTTWTSAGAVSGWTVSGNNVYETLGGNVGIGTITTAGGSLIVKGGNVGIGSAWPGQLVDVQGTVRAIAFVGDGSGITGISGAIGGLVSGYIPRASSSTTIVDGTMFDNGNIGIGSAAPGQTLDVQGTIRALAGIINGNLGIGSAAPGQALDVNGTVRMMNFTMSGQTPISGYVLTASDSAGDTTWTSASAVSGWTVSGNNVYETLSGNVGIGTTAISQGALVVTNGNVGIGTWVPSAPLTVGANAFTVNSTGAITAMTGITTSGGYTQTGNSINAFNGNVGIGSAAPGQALDVNGTVRTTFFTMSGQTPISGYVLTASDSAGDTTWASGGSVGGWTVSGNNVYEALSGNVGIGTTALQTALAVTNGNVGIGTWTAANPLSIIGGVSIGTTGMVNTAAPANGLLVSGNVGVGSAAPGQAVDVNGTVRALFFVGNGTGITGINTGGWSQSGTNIYTVTGSNNVGIGTLTPQAGFVVTNGNVGIGTWTAANPLSIVGGVSIGTTGMANTPAPANGLLVSGNVGIGSTAPGQALDVNGTVRMTLLTMSGQTPISGYVLTASDSAGDTTWTSGGAVSGWTVSGNNVYETYSGNVGIGTTSVTQGALVVTNGNVGIGTWAPSGLFQINKPSASPFAVTSAGNVGIGTITPQGALTVTSGNVGIGTWVPAAPLTVGANAFTVNSTGAIATSGGYTQSGNSINTFSGNVGIGSLTPGQVLDVAGTIRTTAFAMSGQTPISGYVLTASDSAGDTTWSSGPSVAGWTISGNNVYESLGGNVGIGTTQLTTSALTVMNGNVGIGTWVTAVLFQINKPSASPFAVTSAGNVGIGTITPQGAFTVTNGNVGVGTWVPGALFQVGAGSNTMTVDNTGQVTVANRGVSIANGSGFAGGNTDFVTGSTSSFWEQGNGTFNTNAITALYNTGTIANVGINTTVPTGALEIEGGNVGIGTAFTQNAALTVMGGNVGIGTWLPAGLLQINKASSSPFIVTNSGNVGVNSMTPGQAVDVQGTVRALYFVGNGSGITGINSGGWVQSGTNVYTQTGSNNVGIGTTTPQGGFVVTNGNVGIGTWAPGHLLDVYGPNGGNWAFFGDAGTSPAPGLLFGATGSDSGSQIQFMRDNGTASLTISNSSGALPDSIVSTADDLNLTYDTVNLGRYLSFIHNTTEVARFNANGNLGIGSTAPGQLLDVSGTVRTKFFTMSGQTPISGYVLTASDSAGDTTWTSGGSVSGWTVSGNNVYETFSGNVGIGTTALQTALAVTNGNVGIGTWTAVNPLSIVGGVSIGTTGMVNTAAPPNGLLVSGNVGVGSAAPGQAVDVNGTVRALFFVGNGSGITGINTGGWVQSGGNVYTQTGSNNVGIGTTTPQGGFVVTNGNVGIGTWAPANLLDVVGGNIGIGTQYDLVGIGTTSSILTLQGDVSSIYLGWQAGANATGLSRGNTAVGNQALYLNTVGSGNSALGQGALYTNTTGTSNSAFGQNSLYSNSTGIQNTAMGLNALYTNSTGAANTAVGLSALVANTSGSSNSAMGASALAANTTGSQNSALGDEAGNFITGGAPNQTSGSSIYLGYQTEALQDGDTNETVIGYQAVGIGNNSIMLGNNLVTKTELQGNVGIGTVAFNGKLVVLGGNVGIGSLAPGQVLDVTGTVRATSFTMSGQTPISGYVLTASDSAGDTTWSSGEAVSGWTISGNNVYEAFGGNVGIGTTSVTQGALIVTNGNVGIGTWVPVDRLSISADATLGSGSPRDGLGNGSGQLMIQGGANTNQRLILGYDTTSDFGFVTAGIDSTAYKPLVLQPIDGFGNGGNVGISTTGPLGKLVVWGGNVGIGTRVPGQALDVTGTIRTMNFTMSGQTPISGYVLTASDSAGDTTWTSGEAVSGWTVSGKNVYEALGGNVGIGTTALQIALAVTNGNVGIGTWTAANPLSIVGGVSIGTTGMANTTAPANGLLVSGNVGVGSAAPGQLVDVQGTVRALYFVGNGSGITGINAGGWVQSGTNVYTQVGSNNVGIGTTTPQGGLVVTNGNVGIGTWAPQYNLDMKGSLGIGTVSPGSNFVVTSTGNVGIGSLNPASQLSLANGALAANGSNYLLSINGTIPATPTADIYSNFINMNSAGSAAFQQRALVIDLNPGYTGTKSTQALWVFNSAQGTGTALGNSSNSGNIAGYLETNSTTAGTNYGAVGQAEGGAVNSGVQGLSLFNVNSGVNIGVTGFALNQGTSPIELGGYFSLANTPPTYASAALMADNGGEAQPIFVARANGIEKLRIDLKGNLGIGSAAPGQALDVTGTVRATNFTMSGQTPISGYVMTASDSAGDTTWTSGGAVSGWTVTGSNVYETLNGNVGIGTFNPSSGKLIVSGGNVGVGSLSPGQLVDVQGTVRALYFVGNGAGITGINSGGWVQSGTNVYTQTGSNNVGIGTNTPQSGLVVTNGNVGIGTWTTANVLSVVFNSGVSSGYHDLAVFGQGGDSGSASLSNDSGVKLGYYANGTAVLGGLVRSYDNNPLFLGTTNNPTGLTISDNTNVGIGTTTPQGGFVVTNGNVGIGTWVADSGSLIIKSGNVGIGTIRPGQALDVSGTVRTTGFTMSGQTPISGYILTASDSAGDTTWTSGGAVSGWTVSGNNVYETLRGNVGIGTTALQTALAVTNGNVGIGTWTAANPLSIIGGVSIGTTGMANTAAPANGLLVSGNVGVGSAAPGQLVDVQGTVRALFFVGNGAGITGLNAGGWSQSGTNVYTTTGSNNVGIGTSTPQGGLVVTNGNVGIGTWAPRATLDVEGTLTVATFSGSVGIGTLNPGGNLDIWNTGNSTYAQIGMDNNNVTTPFSTNMGSAVYIHTIGSLNQNYASFGGLALSGFSAGDHAAAILDGYVGNTTPSNPAVVLSGFKTNGGTSSVAMSGSDKIAQFYAGDITSGTPVVTVQANGNVGIGTFAPNGELIVSGGNVGISSLTPGQALDVTGTVRATAFTMSGQTPISGYVLTASDSAGDTTWTSGGAVSGWTVTGSNVYESLNGNVGIGTFAPNAKLIVSGGNVGIGSLSPGQLVDVQGTVRALYFVGNGAGITGLNAGGWSQSGTNVYTTTGSNNVGIGTSTPQGGLVVTNGNVGVGTWVPINALDVNGGSAFGSYAGKNTASANGMIISGNVGIGTILAQGPLQVRTGADQNGFFQTNQNLANGVAFSAVNDKNSANVDLELRGSVVQLSSIGNNPVNILTNDSLNSQNTIRFIVDGSGNVSIGTTPFNAKLGIMGNIGIGTVGNGDNFLTTAPPNGGMIIEGNVGIGSVNPGQKLDVQGTVRTTFFTMSGQTPISGYVLTASDSAGNTTWTSGPSVSGWTIVGNNVYETLGGNVGIGTITEAGGNLIVNGGGNVGIGSAWPGQLLDVQGTARVSGNVGIGSSITDSSGTQRLTITASTVEINLQ